MFNSPLPQPPLPDLKPLTDMATEVIDKGTDLANTIIERIDKVDPKAIDDLLEKILNRIDSHAKSILDKVKEVYTAAPQLPANPPTVDVFDTLTKIADAINQAETILNKQNLVILTGNVEAELNVMAAKGSPGAHAKISFQITPKPQN